MEYKIGDKVKFAEPEDADEASLIMTVLEDNGNRVLVGYIVNADWFIHPQATYLKSDLIPAE